MKRAVLVETLPSSLTEGVMVRIKQGEEYPEMKETILNYAATEADSDGPTPMDCSYVKRRRARSMMSPGTRCLNWMSKGENKGKSNGQGLPGTTPQLWPDRASSGEVHQHPKV